MKRYDIEIPETKPLRHADDKPEPLVNPIFAWDLARANMENDLPAADCDEHGCEPHYPHPDSWEP